MESKTSIARVSFSTGVWIGWVVLRASSARAVSFQSASRRRMPQSGLKRSVAFPPIHEAKPSFSHRLSHQAIVTRLPNRSEEHTSELQSRGHLVCRLLLEKKKKKKLKYKIQYTIHH